MTPVIGVSASVLTVFLHTVTDLRMCTGITGRTAESKLRLSSGSAQAQDFQFQQCKVTFYFSLLAIVMVNGDIRAPLVIVQKVD